MRIAALILSSTLCACYATESGQTREPVVEYEMAYDDNRPSEEIRFISTTYEAMVRFAPPSKFRPTRLRMLVSKPGRLRWTVYAQDSFEQPGDVLATWERDYAESWVSGPTDGRWVVEDLTGRVTSTQGGPIWVGVRRSGGAPQIWATSLPSDQAFVRDSDPSHFLKPMPVRKTPMIRLDWVAP